MSVSNVLYTNEGILGRAERNCCFAIGQWIGAECTLHGAGWHNLTDLTVIPGTFAL